MRTGALKSVCASLGFLSVPANSADLARIEPEPAGKVRICEAYGKRFFYIPGTETCIRFYGYVRSHYAKTAINPDDDASFDNYRTASTLALASASPDDDFLAIDGNNYTRWAQRGRLNIDTRNETDWGTLRAQYRLEGGSSNVDVDIDMDRALISLAGFRFGFTDNYWTTNHDYSVIDISGFSGVSVLGANPSGDGWYGFDDATLADYTWAQDGLTVTVGMEDPRISSGRGDFNNLTNNGSTDGRVNFYTGMNLTGDWGFAAFTAVYDSIAPNNGTTFGARCTGCPVTSGPAATGQNNGGWAYKASLSLELDNVLPGGVIHGMVMWDGEYDTDYVGNFLTTNDPELIWQVAGGIDLTDQLEFAAQYSYSQGDRSDILIAENQSAWIASAGLNWFPVEGLELGASYARGAVSGQQGALATAANLGTNPWGHTGYHFDQFAVVVRRSF